MTDQLVQLSWRGSYTYRMAAEETSSVGSVSGDDKRIFVAGATGVLGRRLVEQFVRRGHDVVGLTRDRAGDRVVAERGGDPKRGDVFDRDSVRDAAEGANVIVHAATAIPTATRPTRAAWRRNDAVRIDGARNLVAVARAVDASKLLLQSVVWVARRPDGSQFDESAPTNPDRTTRSAAEAERVVREGARDRSFDAVVLRGGWFYAHDAPHTVDFRDRLQSGDLPVVGAGVRGQRSATLSLVHPDDMAAAFVAAAEADVTGTFHVVDDRPVSLATFLTAFADRLDAPEPSRVPGWLARFVVGSDAVRFLTQSMPTSNERLRAAVDWAPRYPTYREGLDQVTAAWTSTVEPEPAGAPRA